MKNALLTFGIILLAGVATAQCNPQFTITPAPTGNDLLRVAVTNNSVLTPAPARFASYDIQTSVGSTTSFPSGSTAYFSYASPGSYVIRLIQHVFDSVGSNNYHVCGDTMQQTYALSYPSCGSTANYTHGSAGNVLFAAATPSGTPGMNYSWNFGDGSAGTGINSTHAYAQNGRYTVTLTATGSNSCSYTNSFPLVVTSWPINCTGNNAVFTSSLSNNVATFSNLSTGTTGANVLQSYRFDFGDSDNHTTYDQTQVTHTYLSNGSFGVKLTSVWRDSISNDSCVDVAFDTVTTTNAPYIPGQIEGMIIRNDTALSAYNDLMRVWLIAYDSAANTLHAVDSVSVDSANNWSTTFANRFVFNNVVPGSYLLKAARIGGVIGLTGPVPTYLDSSLYWSQAKRISVLAGHTYSDAWIYMRNGAITSGPGFIAGNISLGANRGTAIGVPGMGVFLRDQASKSVVKSTVTDAGGNYSFQNVAAGLYDVYPESLNYATTERAGLAITSIQRNLQAINFFADPTKLTIKPQTTIIKILAEQGAAASIFPNPAKGSVTLTWKDFDGTPIDLRIMNITGQLVHDQQLSGAVSGTTSINIAQLQPGIYSLHLHSNDGELIEKLVVQP